MAKSRDNKDKSSKNEDEQATDEHITSSETDQADDAEQRDDSLPENVSDEDDTSDSADSPEKSAVEAEGENASPENDDEAADAKDTASEDGESAEQTAADPGDSDSSELITDDTAEKPNDSLVEDAGDEDADEKALEKGEESTPEAASSLVTAKLLSDGAEPEEPAPIQPAAETPEPEPHHEDHDEEEEHGRSFASRALTWLILLIAGGGIALWGGPRIAPSLPSGLGPVKAWLMPGTLESEARISALETDLGARIDGIVPGVDEATVSAAVSDAIAEAEARFEAGLTALSDKVEASDGADVEGRLAQMETRLEGVLTQIEGLTGMATDGTNSEELGAFAATVDGLRAEISALAEQQGGLSQRIDDVEVAVTRKLEEAEEEIATAAAEAEQTKSDALATAALTAIEAAISAGEPFEVSLAQYGENIDGDVPEALSAVAGTGVATLGALRSSFSDAAHAAIRADVQERDAESVGGRLAAFIESQVATRSLTPQEGDSTDAVLSRAEDALRRDNLAAALQELDGLSLSASVAMGGWLSRAAARADAVSALNTLRGTSAASN